MGKSPFKYIQALSAHLFLSANPKDVKQALKAGHAAATILSSAKQTSSANNLPKNYTSLSTVMLFYSLMKQNVFISKRTLPPSPLMKNQQRSCFPVGLSKVCSQQFTTNSSDIFLPISVSLKLYAPGIFASTKLYSLAVSKKANSSTPLEPISSSTIIKPTLSIRCRPCRYRACSHRHWE